MVYLFLFYVHWCFACIYVRVSDSLELDLQTVISYHMGSGNQSQVLWKSSQFSYYLSHLFSPRFIYLIVYSL